MRSKINYFLILTVLVNIFFLIDFTESKKVIDTSKEGNGVYSVEIFTSSGMVSLQGRFILPTCEESYHFTNTFTQSGNNTGHLYNSINLVKGEKMVKNTALFLSFTDLAYSYNGFCRTYLAIMSGDRGGTYPLDKITIDGRNLTIISNNNSKLKFSYLY